MATDLRCLSSPNYRSTQGELHQFGALCRYGGFGCRAGGSSGPCVWGTAARDQRPGGVCVEGGVSTTEVIHRCGTPGRAAKCRVVLGRVSGRAGRSCRKVEHSHSVTLRISRVSTATVHATAASCQFQAWSGVANSLVAGLHVSKRARHHMHWLGARRKARFERETQVAEVSCIGCSGEPERCGMRPTPHPRFAIARSPTSTCVMHQTGYHVLNRPCYMPYSCAHRPACVA